MDLSIVIVNWNAKDYIDRCISSLIENIKDIDYEIIVVDNASSDGSVELIRSKYDEVTLMESDLNLGFAKGNNVGINQASGKYIALINSDISIHNNCFRLLIDFMDHNKDVGLCGPKILNSDHTLQLSCRKLPTLWNVFCSTFALNKVLKYFRIYEGSFMDQSEHDRIKEVEVLSGCFWFSRKKAVDEIGLLDERFFMYAEDIDWCLRFHESSWKIIYYPDAEAVHYGGASSGNAPIRFYVEMQKAIFQYWRKHYSTGANTIFTIIFIVHQLIRISTRLPLIFVPTRKQKEYSYKVRRSIASLNWLFSTLLMNNR